MNLDAAKLLGLYDAMLLAYGEQDWWPADTDFEICVGAVLTQNAAWVNVEKAIVNLKAAGVLHLHSMLELPESELADLIRPSGYFNIKAKRLLNLCRFIQQAGGISHLSRKPLSDLREAMLGVNGIGPETADDILLYALDKPVFVIDTYTRRLLSRHGLIKGNEGYESLRAGFEKALTTDTKLFSQYHALIVQHAKMACRKKPDCESCCMTDFCLKRIN